MRNFYILATFMAVFAVLGVIQASTEKKNKNTGVQASDLQEMTAADYSATRLICPDVGAFTAPCECCTNSVALGHQKTLLGRKALLQYLFRQRTSADPDLALRYPSNRNT